MAKHIYVTNTEGGYFYRFYPKIKRVRTGPKDKEKLTLFDFMNSPESNEFDNRANIIYGKFVDKYHDKHLCIELLAEAEFVLTDNFTGDQEIRKLTSNIVIVATDDWMYKYPFIKDSIYAITVHEITPL